MLNYGLWAAFAISILLLFTIVFNLDGDLSSPLDNNFYWLYFLLAVAGILILGFSLVQIFTSGGDKKKSLIALGVAVVLFLVAYGMSSPELPKFPSAQKLIEDGVLTPGVSMWVDTGLYLTYFVAAISAIVVVVSGFVRFKK